MLFILVPLIFVFYFGTLALAAFVFPESYELAVERDLESPFAPP
jgi:hypothetical protein